MFPETLAIDDLCYLHIPERPASDPRSAKSASLATLCIPSNAATASLPPACKSGMNESGGDAIGGPPSSRRGTAFRVDEATPAEPRD